MPLLENLQKEAAAPVDDATKAIIEQARAQVRRGETVSLEQSKANARERYRAWQKVQEKTMIAA